MSRLSRREFFRLAAAGGTAWTIPGALAFAQAPIGQEDVPPEREALNDAEWRTLEAVAARILPSDGGPGALEAGAAWFVDRALAHEDAAQRRLYAAGLLGVEKLARERFGRAFVEIADGERDECLRQIESGEVPEWPAGGSPAAFFAAVRRHVILGFLADPKYGGNANFAGWRAAGHPGPRHHYGAKIARGTTAQQLVGGQPIVPIWEETGIRTRFL